MEEVIAEIVATIIGLAMVIGIPLAIIGIIGYFIYEYFYFKSEEFLEIKKSIESNTKECNELNEHIEELKKSYVDFKQTDFGEAEYIDNSKFNYKRPELNKTVQSNHVYNCSLQVCKNAQQQPFKYLCKYFNIKTDEETLEKFEKVLNDFSAVEEGKNLLKKQRDEIIAGISDKIPFLIRTFGKNKLIAKLGFEKIDFSNLYFPKYTFQYISGGGNSSMNCNIVFNIDTLNRFVNYLADTVKFRKSIAGQRALMTSKLREKIKQRDNYTCQHCGNSTEREPNLLLEIDHIIPLSKNGQSTEDNLQTLCWKCNRSKGSKIINKE